MENPQGIQFEAVENFLKILPKEELDIVLFLRKIILECMPDCKEKLAYNVPFYYRHSRICYIWPASGSMGNVSRGVAIGFCKTASFLDVTFEKEQFNSKQVFTSVKEIDVSFLKQKINEAIVIDEQIVKLRRRRIQ